MLKIFRPDPRTPWNWLTLSGPDAEDLLHRISTTHVRALQLGQGAPGCILNAQGRIRASFFLWKLRPDEFGFELDGGLDGERIQELKAAIDELTFAEKISWSEATLSESAWILGETTALPHPLLTLHPGETVSWEEGLRACHHGDRDYGTAWISLWGDPAKIAAWLRDVNGMEMTWEELERLRIENVRPRAGIELTATSNPLEIGLKDSIADNKGCYPGQEVIERIVALGAPARRLVRIDGEGSLPTPGAKIRNLAEPPAEVGELTSLSAAEGGFRALGIVRKMHAKEGLEVRFENGATGRIARVAPYQ